MPINSKIQILAARKAGRWNVSFSFWKSHCYLLGDQWPQSTEYSSSGKAKVTNCLSGFQLSIISLKASKVMSWKKCYISLKKSRAAKIKNRNSLKKSIAESTEWKARISKLPFPEILWVFAPWIHSPAFG